MLLSEILKEAKAPQNQIDAALKMEDKMTEVNAEAATRRKTVKELKEQLAEFDGVDPAKYKEAQKKMAKLEEDRLKADGNYAGALDEATKTLKAEVESLKGIIDTKGKALSTALIDTAVLTAIDGKAINNDQVLSLLRGNIKMDGEAPMVMNGDAPRLNTIGDKMSVAEYANDFLTQNTHLVNPKGGGSGSGGNINTNKGGENQITRKEYDGMDAVAQAKHFKDGGTIVDSQ